MSNTIQKLYGKGQSVWCDQLGRSMIESGELARLIDLGVVGVTSNPTIFMKAIADGDAYDQRLHALLENDRNIKKIYEGLVMPDIADAADLLRPIYDRTDGVDGFVSLEVDPRIAYDTDRTIVEARRLFATLNRPNVFIKVPATEEGIPAVETLIGEGINVNVTLIFSIAMYGKVMQAYVAGLGRVVRSGGDPSRVASVASFFVSRVDTLVDRLVKDKFRASVPEFTGAAAIANAKLAYAQFEKFFDATGDFQSLAARGARVQRPLWASTSAKDPSFAATKYVDGLVAPNTVNTMPPHTIAAFLREGSTEVTIRDGVPEAHTIFEQLESHGIHIKSVTDKLTVDGVALFVKSFDDLLANIERKSNALRAAG